MYIGLVQYELIKLNDSKWLYGAFYKGFVTIRKKGNFFMAYMIGGKKHIKCCNSLEQAISLSVRNLNGEFRNFNKGPSSEKL